MKPLRHRIIRKRGRRVALLIESSRAYGRGLFLGIAKFVREHHEWSVQSEEWKWTDAFPAWLKNWGGDGIIARVETPEMAAFIKQLGVPAVDLRGSVSGFGLPLIDTDDRKVANLAAEHLMNRGFRHYAFLWIRRSQLFRQALPMVPGAAGTVRFFMSCLSSADAGDGGANHRIRKARFALSGRPQTLAGFASQTDQESWRAMTFAASMS